MAWAFSIYRSWPPEVLTDFTSTRWQALWLMPAKCLLSYPCPWEIDGRDTILWIFFIFFFFFYFYILISFLKCVNDIICTRKKVRLLGWWEPFCALLSDGINHWESFLFHTRKFCSHCFRFWNCMWCYPTHRVNHAITLISLLAYVLLSRWAHWMQGASNWL